MSVSCRCGPISPGIFLLTSLMGVTAQAETFVSNSLTGLYGRDFKLGEPVRRIFTFEHASRWSWGDQFLFIDETRDASGSNTYGEWSPRIKLHGFDNRTVTALYFAANFERGAGGVSADLFGVGLGLNISGFTFANLALYQRDTEGRAGNTWQVTGNWSWPFSVGTSQWRLDGFFDWIGAEGASRSNLMLVPQIKCDVGAVFGLPKQQLFVGVEWQRWQPKFGAQLAGNLAHERVPQLMVQGFF